MSVLCECEDTSNTKTPPCCRFIIALKQLTSATIYRRGAAKSGESRRPRQATAPSRSLNQGSRPQSTKFWAVNCEHSRFSFLEGLALECVLPQLRQAGAGRGVRAVYRRLLREPSANVADG